MTRSKHTRAVPTQERAIRTVSRIKETAIELLSRQRYESITTNQIAREANLSIGSLYKYFPNKEALLLEIARDLIDEGSEIVKESVKQHHEKSARDLLLFQFEQLGKISDPGSSYLSFVIPFALKEREIYRMLVDQLSDYVLLYLAHNKDRYRVEDPSLTAKAVSMAVLGMWVGFLEEESPVDFQRVAQEVAKLLERMLAGGEG